MAGKQYWILLTRMMIYSVENMGLVYYDVTTLYFEASPEEELRNAGFSKDRKHQHPQFLVGRPVGSNGYVWACEIFESDKIEGHTMIPGIEKLQKKYQLGKSIIISDFAL